MHEFIVFYLLTPSGNTWTYSFCDAEDWPKRASDPHARAATVPTTRDQAEIYVRNLNRDLYFGQA